MASSFRSSRTIRWAVPVGAVVVAAAAAGSGPVIAAARGNPSLPPKTAGQLLAAADLALRDGRLPPQSGTVVESASLGLPALPGRRDDTSAAGLLSGAHTMRVWYADRDHVRTALLGTGSETDLIRSGQDVWHWESGKNTVTHTRLPEGRRPMPSPSRTLTPQQAAEKALAAVGESTVVRVDPTARVAGRDVYELVLVPKDGRSLIGQVRLALDGKNYSPLRVQVYPRGGKSPAAQVGYTSVTFARPAAANFAFKPPAGAKVVEKKVPARPARPRRSAGSEPIGSGWLTVQRFTVPQNAQAGDRSGIAAALRKAATPVRGSWGSGRVLRTKLFSALLTDDGRLYVGAVTPDVLTQAAARR